MKKQNIDWGNLKFEVLPTRSMWQAEGQAGNAWAKGELIPYGKVKMSPASCVMNYGQGVFEGLKAYHTARDRIVLFRPQMNAKRMGQSTQRICIPEITEDYFLEAIGQTVSDNIDFVPPYKQGSMYIRPISFGTSPSISVGPSSDYLFMVFVSPVGPYFKGGVKPLHLIVSEKYHRAAPKGIGNAKAIGNYSSSLLPGSKAKSAGFNEVIYMKASDETYVEEMGAANLFSLTGNILKTPKLGGSILPGITRDSVIPVSYTHLTLPTKA